MAGMAELRTQPDPNALSATQARRMIAARSGGIQTGGQPAVRMQAPTPQMRGPTGQMGPAVPGVNAQGQQPSVSPQPGGMQGQVAQARSLAMSRGVDPRQGPTPTSAGGALAQARSLAASGGVSPTSGQPSTPPGQPSAGPTPPTTQPPGYDFGGLRKDIQGFGPAPALDESTMARMRAQQDDRLRRQYEANVSELGASAASSGALFGGDVRQLAAGFAAERGRQMSDFELGLDTKAFDQGREDYYKQFDAATGLASQRAGFQQQTSERLGGQAYGSEEQQKQRNFVGDENAKNRLAQVAAQEKDIAAQQASLQAQIKAAADQGDLNRANALQLQLAPLAQQAAEMKQQNDQFLAGIGLDRERFEEAASQFDLTRQDGVNQFAQNLDLQNRQMTQQGTQFNAQLAQSLAIANMDDQTRRWVTQLQADMNNPTEFQTALSALGTIASIPGLGERIFGGLFGGSGGAGNLGPEMVDDGTGNFVPSGGAAGSTGGMSNLASAGVAALAAGGAAALIDKAFEPGSSEWWDVAAGQVMGGALGAAFGGIVGFGRDAQQAAQEKFTTAFDKAYQGLEQGGFLQKPPTDPQSFWNPAVRASVAKGFQQAVAESAKIGTSAQEISEPDWQRMERLGLGAVVNGTDRSRHYLVDDPRITAILGKDATSDWLTFELAGRNDDTNYSQLGGSLKRMIERGGVTVRDKKTGEIIDLNNAEQLKAIAARNGGAQ